METLARPGHDPVLVPFLQAQDASETDRRLSALLTGPIEETTRLAIRRALRPGGRPWADAQDVEDLRGEVLVRLMRKLRDLKAEASPEPIADFGAYAAAVAYHVCYEYMRRRRPEWTRLRNQVRYRMTHDPAFSLRLKDDTWICAPAAGPRTIAPRDADDQRLPLPDLMKAILERTGAPIELDEFVTAIAAVRGVRDHDVSAPSRGGEERMESIPDPRALVSTTLDDVEYLARVWSEVRQLPVRQRAALLLNLRDALGRGVVTLFPLTGTASIAEIGAALEVPSGEFARLWNDLPLDDRQIAARLGVSRQQVINLRKAARQRLARRLAKPPVS